MGRRTLREAVKYSVLNDATLLSLLGDGGNSYYPRPGTRPDGDTPTPFMVAKFGPVTGRIHVISGWQFYIYDDPRREYWRIEEIIKRLRETFDFLYMPPSEDGYMRWGRVYMEYVSTPLVDGNWNKNMQFCRFSVDGV